MGLLLKKEGQLGMHYDMPSSTAGMWADISKMNSLG